MLTAGLQAEVPAMINYQGRLTDLAGAPLDSIVPMTFTVFADSAGAITLWSETHSAVVVAEGVFSVLLGAVTPIPDTVFGGQRRWLRMQVDGGPLSDPPLPVVSVAYAFRAIYADTAAVALSGSGSQWTLSGSNIYYNGGNVGIGTTNPQTPLHVSGNVRFDKNQGELILRTPTHNDPGRFIIRFDNNLLGVIQGDDSENQTFGFYSAFGATRAYDARIEIHGKATSSWGKSLSLTHDGTNGYISTDAGNIILSPQQSLLVNGVVHSQTGGFKFPDGSLQTTAVAGGSGLTLPFEGTITTTSPGFKVTNLGAATGIQGFGGTTGLRGESNTTAVRTTYGVYASSMSSGTSYGVYATAANYGVYGAATSGSVTNYGIYGKSANSNSQAGYGIYGEGVGTAGLGVYGINTNSSSYGYLGGVNYGAYGKDLVTGNYGYLGGSYGVYGEGGIYGHTSGSGYGVRAVADASAGTGLFAMGGTSGYAADFRGNVRIFSRATNEHILELGEGLDYAEGFDVSCSTQVEPGTVMIIDPENPGHLAISTCEYDSRVAGIIAGAKGLGSGVRLGAGQFDHNVALAGRVYCKVDATFGEVKPGDLLTTSFSPGYAMVVRDHEKARGAIIGKAMQPLSLGEKGEILVLVTLQ